MPDKGNCVIELQQEKNGIADDISTYESNILKNIF